MQTIRVSSSNTGPNGYQKNKMINMQSGRSFIMLYEFPGPAQTI